MNTIILYLFIFLTFLSFTAFGQNPKAVNFYNRGLELQNAGDLDGALAEYEKAIAVNPRAHFESV